MYTPSREWCKQGKRVYRVPEESGKNDWFKLRSREGGEM